MTVLLLQGVISFIFVFLKGFQHQNVIGGKYMAAFGTSYVMAIAEVAVISFVVQAGWWSIIPIGTGAAFGIVASMWLYRATETHGLFGTLHRQLKRILLRRTESQA